MADLCIRDLCSDDLDNGFLDALDALRPTSQIDPADARAILEQLDRNPDATVAVAEREGRIVGTATLFIQHKFLYGGSTFGSIEDVAVAVDQQGTGIGRALINHLLARAQEANCYKTVLYCEDEVLPFYAKIGFRRTTNGMRYDHPTATTSASGTA